MNYQYWKILAEQFEWETAACSTTRSARKAQSYPALITAGPDSLPWILERLGHSDCRFFWMALLHDLTGARPAHDSNGVDEAAKAWQNWGCEQGYFQD